MVHCDQVGDSSPGIRGLVVRKGGDGFRDLSGLTIGQTHVAPIEGGKHWAVLNGALDL